MSAIAFVLISIVYTFFWRNNGGNVVLYLLTEIFNIEYELAMDIYQMFFRNNVDIIWGGAISIVFLALFIFFIKKFTGYFDEINRGIDALMIDSDSEIILPSEMIEVENKLNTVRKTLIKRTKEVQMAEQRKNELVMYLAHDIRTPLTSVIGYLNLLGDMPDMPMDKRAKYLNITLEKSYRLETLINHFFEITRYNSGQIKLNKSKIDLHYMLVQIIDEFYPTLTLKGNTAIIETEENISLYADPIELARVFNNLLKNAVNYSTPNTEINLSAAQKDDMVIIQIKNITKTIPKEKLSEIFNKFNRLDENRSSDTGGSGLGLSIAKEIIDLHDGTLFAESENDTVTFTVSLPFST